MENHPILAQALLFFVLILLVIAVETILRWNEKKDK